jgi:superfamily II DNA/RNA helicase
LLERLAKLGLERPTQIQAKTFAQICGEEDNDDGDDSVDDDEESSPPPSIAYANDVTIGAETGSGKTLAYLLPLLDEILTEKSSAGSDGLPPYDYARAFVLVPNKELVQQVLRMAIPLCGGSLEESLVWAPGGGASQQQMKDQLSPLAETSKSGSTDPSSIVRLAVMPGGLKEPMDFKPFRDSIGFGGNQAPVDIVVSTPAALGPLGLPPKFVDLFADVNTLVVDEADMLLDGGYIRALENVLVGFRRSDKLVTPSSGMMGAQKTQHVFCAATLPDVGLKSVNAYLERKFPYSNRIETDNLHNAKHYGLSRATKWYQVESKKERMERLTEMLLEERSDESDDGLKGEKTMVFLNSVEDVEGVHQALVQRGVDAVPYHAKISLNDRSENLDRFRRYNREAPDEKSTVPVFVCTDLASRGLDVPGVTAVVQLQFSGNVVSHLHRMGRCGRAGQRTGRGIVFYDEREADLVEVVRDAEAQQETMRLEGQQVDDRLDDEGLDADEKAAQKGKVQKAFSRKRGFTKKRKKMRREETGYY